MQKKEILSVKNLNLYFSKRQIKYPAIQDVCFNINEGETVGLVGESGCGKSITATAIMNMLPNKASTDGEIIFTNPEGKKFIISSLDPTGKEMQSIRTGEIGMIFQEPMTSLNPVYSINRQISEAIRAHGKYSKKEAFNQVVDLLRYVGISDPEKRANQYPHQFSGGMRQRAMIAMAIKGSGIWSRFSKNVKDKEAPLKMIKLLDEYHGSITGMFTGDECLAGKDPNQGTELCSVVEYMYSLEWLTAITGDPIYSDRLERITFNALPATFLPDMWAHQYDQMVNQVECSLQKEFPFKTNSSESHLFGLEPNFGCCTANMHQGWPKFAASAVMGYSDGLVINSYVPLLVNNKDFKIEISGSYPFIESAEIQVKENLEGRKRPLKLRIPGWCSKAEIKFKGKVFNCDKGGYFEMNEPWVKNDSIQIKFYSNFKLENNEKENYALVKGPLVYSLRIKEQQKEAKEVLRRTTENIRDTNWELYPASEWKYSFVSDSAKTIEEIHHEFGKYIFSPENPPLELKVKVREADWDFANGFIKKYNKAKPDGKVLKVVFIPYGCTNLRLTEMPIDGGIKNEQC